MISFLEKLANHLIETSKVSLEETCIVLPNRRAGLFLRKHLANKLNKVSWSPKILSIEDFVADLSQLRSVDNLTLIFEFYEVYKTITDEPQNLDDFVKWAQTLLHDFNELDMHLIDAKQCFHYLNDSKAISQWNLGEKPLTEFQLNYLEFYRSLYSYYDAFKSRLKERNIAYQGMIFREVATDLDRLIRSLHRQKIIFAGFNALTNSEEKIMFELEKQGIAEIMWDADDYYVNANTNGVYNDAGLFIRKYQQRYHKSNFNWLETNFREPKSINIYGVPKQVGQAKFCAQLISENPEINASTYKSALVLADEDLIYPILNSISGSEQMNVTMGLPLNSTPLYDLLNSAFEMHIDAEQFKELHKKENLQYSKKNIHKILANSLIEKTSSKSKVFIKLKKMRTSFIDSDILKSELCESEVIFKEIFLQWNSPLEAVDLIIDVFQKLKECYIDLEDQDSVRIELEYLYQFVLVFNKISNYLNTYRSVSSLKSLHNLFKQISRSTKLSLYGEPLKGLQVMGMLESRSLDFEHLILTSVNENILPSSSKQNSFIPYDIKKELGLPTYREKNAVFAYHFYRLLQRSKNIHITYNTEADTVGGGDKSRFLQQIIQELDKYNPEVKIQQHLVHTTLDVSPSQAIEIKKNAEIIELLDAKVKRGLSPTSINRYLLCPLQFYFKDLAGIQEPDEVSDTIDIASFGTIIHDCLNTLYQPFIGMNLHENDLKSMLKQIEDLVHRSLSREFPELKFDRAKNYLIRNVIIEYIKAFIKTEMNNLKNNKDLSIRIRGLEKFFLKWRTI